MTIPYGHILSRYPIISDQIDWNGLSVVMSRLEKILQDNTAGDIVEFGCYIGTTSLFIRRLLDEHLQSETRSFYAYDSFAGLPAKSVSDRSAAGVDFTDGELAVSKKHFLQEFQKAQLRPPITKKAWFADLAPEDLPPKIAFAFLDGDFYDSILTSLQLVWPRLCPNATIVIDDYKRPELPGVERAIDHFIADKQGIHVQHEHDFAIITAPVDSHKRAMR